MFVSYGEEYFEGLRSNRQMYEAKVQKYKEACKQREQSQTEKQQVERTLSSMMEAINLRTEVEDDVSKNLKYVKEMYLKKYKQLDEVNMKLTRDKEILQLTTHKLAYSNGELERHKRKLRDQLEEKAKLAKLLEERNRSLEREQRKANKAMQELVINFGHLAYEMNEKKKGFEPGHELGPPARSPTPRRRAEKGITSTLSANDAKMTAPSRSGADLLLLCFNWRPNDL